MIGPGLSRSGSSSGGGMDAREHAVISDLIADDAARNAVTAEDELAADWRRETDRRRHESPRRARLRQGAPTRWAARR